MAKRKLPPAPPGYKYVFRPWRTDPRTGERLFASRYGLRAWAMLVPE